MYEDEKSILFASKSNFKNDNFIENKSKVKLF